jgi:hypothetical protein
MTGTSSLTQPRLGTHLSDHYTAWSWTLDDSAGYKDVQQLHQRWVDVAGYTDATRTLSSTRAEASHTSLRLALDVSY